MNRQQKEHIIASLRTEFQKCDASFIVGYRGLSVVELVDLRRRLDKVKSKFQVAKITLIKRAIADKDEAEGLDPYLADQVALVFAPTESTSVAKVLIDFAKTHENLKIVAGCYEHTVLSADTVKQFASLPSREILMAQLCGVLKAPTARLVGVLNNVLAQLPVAIQQIQNKKSTKSE